MKLTQRLCPEGRRLRQAVENLTPDMPLLDKERAVKAYFWHKNKFCHECDLRWVQEEE